MNSERPSDPPGTPSPPNPASPMGGLVRDFLRRRSKGERLSVDEFMQACPESSEALRSALHRAELVSRATEAAESDRVFEALQRITQEPLDRDEPDEVDVEEPPDIRMTMVESPEDIRSTQLVTPPPLFLKESPPHDEELPPLPIRPLHRPPTPILKVFDDNQSTGELIRIRTRPFRIGRREGDLIIPHDSQMADTHASIAWTESSGNYRWNLTDLGTQEGTFVKAQYSRLVDGKRIRVGRHLFQFESGPQPSLIDISSGEPTDAIFLTEGEHWLGRDPTICPSFLLGDATLDRKHALVYQRADGRWWIKSLGAHNGLWIEVTQAELQPNCSFLLGEQRFAFLIPL